LERLLPELLFLILDHLDTSDRACLSLCSHTLRHQIGTSFTDSFRKKDPCREDFLMRHSRDYPQYSCCLVCSTLHGYERIRPPCYNSTLPCIGAMNFTESFVKSLAINICFPTFNPTFQHLQTVMIRHRHGDSRGIALDTLAWVEIRTSDNRGITTLLSVEPRIVSGELCLRIQHWLMMQPDVARDFPAKLSGLGYYAPDIYVHISQSQIPDSLRSLYFCRVLENHSSAIIAAKWLNLGRGNGPSDWKWQRHFWRPHTPRGTTVEEGI
ncbi:hypothetical protein K431DRAFT_231572, partial [Polychaeton citri CBS 116435]